MKKIINIVMSILILCTFTGCNYLRESGKTIAEPLGEMEEIQDFKMDSPESTITEYLNSILDLDEISLKKFYNFNYDVDKSQSFIEIYKITEINDINIYESDIRDDLAFVVVQYSYCMKDIEGKINVCEKYILRENDNKWYITNYDNLNDDEGKWVDNLNENINSDEKINDYINSNIEIKEKNKEFFQELEKKLVELNG
ncbi:MULTISPECIES: hypothetical protein [Clostridium]|uniref:Lipoprotein n=4 Tax=Clostridium butyricum TaxID=1492 RepID=A0AAP9RJ84_CLOBU|nr:MULTISPECIES: hypothetical protein [Clostridium]ALR90699.1 hypothetical protein ATN24_19905 [Clostridium butyricum]ALS18935.1 hypothetical protein ATD26_18850 [Clostridium butyricum]ANF16122.1 hypothetical protein AZ909_18885 [Clostridium butyricum]AOR96034.1 hypothetical protein BBB49_18355 [Clostridium butyricum]AXB86900.1 hypothetical protein DRB99_18475 [Clostridium butyricum]